MELEEEMNAVELKVEGMTCGSCAARVRNALVRVSGVDAVTVDVGAGRATVRSSDEDLMAEELVAALADIGYPATPVAGPSDEAGGRVAGAAAGQCAAAQPAGRRSGCCCAG